MFSFLCIDLSKHTETPEELKNIRNSEVSELPDLCDKYRSFLIEQILEHGGHFSANLGTVELTIALHYVLQTPFDQVIWDVGHQAYLHKVITGRKNSFSSIRKKDGISGFPSQKESDFDAFGTGHSSTSISAILGMAEADKLLNVDRQHVAVIGDGSLTGGMAWEAINNAAVSDTNVLIIINDNQMGIDPNSGALNHYLKNIDKTSNFFTDLGFHYSFNENGHAVTELVETLQSLLTVAGPKVWHIKTKKGKGYAPAEEEQTKWHAVKYVKINEGESNKGQTKFQDVFGKTLLDLARKNKNIIGVTPAMPSGSSMKFLMDELPEQSFDVGIAEQHAVTFSAGLASNGATVFCNIYSTFAQRAYDQIIHDVCLQNLPVIFCLDRAGVVGEDGPTHHGMFDIPFLRAIPNVMILAPSNALELRMMMYTAIGLKQPVVIRYPKGYSPSIDWQVDFSKIALTPRTIETGNSICILALGPLVYEAQKAAIALQKKGVTVEVVDFRTAKPLDTEFIDAQVKKFDHIITLEDGCITGGFGSSICEYLSSQKSSSTIHLMGFPDTFIEHASREELLEKYELDAQGIIKKLEGIIQP